MCVGVAIERAFALGLANALATSIRRPKHTERQAMDICEKISGFFFSHAENVSAKRREPACGKRCNAYTPLHVCLYPPPTSLTHKQSQTHLNRMERWSGTQHSYTIANGRAKGSDEKVQKAKHDCQHRTAEFSLWDRQPRFIQLSPVDVGGWHDSSLVPPAVSKVVLPVACKCFASVQLRSSNYYHHHHQLQR